MRKAIIIIILNCIINSYSIKFPSVPCPLIFSYIHNGEDWTGHILVPAPPISAHFVVISANFSIEGSETVSNGKITLDEQSKAAEKIKNGQKLKFIVTFPRSKYLPKVTQIDIDGNILCYGPPGSSPNTNFRLQYTLNCEDIFDSHQIFFDYPKFATKASTSIPFQVGIVFQTHSPPKEFENYEECGLIRTKRSVMSDYEKRIINGSLIPVNSHPWLAAMFDLSKGSTFFCAGSLISNKHVLTAAHCTFTKKRSKIQVRLGVHNIQNLFDLGSLSRIAVSTMEHPEYKKGKAHADIALLNLDERVVFTQAIKPICLWDFDSDFSAIVGDKGTIMGWGNQEHGDPSTLPMKTEVTIETHKKCKQIDLLKDLVTDETFCAGTKGTGPCIGDSGGGLFLEIFGRWHLRGIISTSLADRYTQICDTSSYSIYVDTAKYMDWILDKMEYK